jgi:hypothetical protein
MRGGVGERNRSSYPVCSIYARAVFSSSGIAAIFVPELNRESSLNAEEERRLGPDNGPESVEATGNEGRVSMTLSAKLFTIDIAIQNSTVARGAMPAADIGNATGSAPF